MHRSAQGRQIAFALHHHAQQEAEDRRSWSSRNTTRPCAATRCTAKSSSHIYATQNPHRQSRKRGSRERSSYGEIRTPRPKPKIDFTVDALDFKNITLLRQFVTDQGRILPRKYTGLPAHYQRRLNRAIKRARQMLLMK